MALLSTHHLSVSVSGKLLCKDLTLQINAGQCWAILGPNGSGKTTLLHTLAGLRPTQGGDIQLRDRPLNAWSSRERAQILGILLQDYTDPFPSTVLETALIGRHPHLDRWQWEDSGDVQCARTALEQMDLAGFETRDIASLSGGERRRLAIAALLTQDPQLFLLDEPTNHLDLAHQVGVMKRLTGIVKGEERAVITVLHDITSATYYCDHALLMFNNGETLSGSITDIITEENMQRLYGHPIRRLAGPDGDVWTPLHTSGA